MAFIAGKNSEFLGKFTWEIIDHPKSMFFLDQNESGNIDWRGSERDMVIFAQVLNLLEQTQEVDDEKFVAEWVDEIESILSYSALFTALDSPDIVVTNGHRGVTPKQHIFNVLRKLRTTGATSAERILLRFEALFHDVGKASSVGMDPAEIKKLLSTKTFPENISSYPDHDKISTLVVQKIRAELPFFKDIFSSEMWLSLEFITLYHHAVSNIFHVKDFPLESFVELVETLEKVSQLTVLVGLYLLNLADVDSNDVYRGWMLDNSSHFGEILHELELDFSENEIMRLFMIYLQGTTFSKKKNQEVAQLVGGSVVQ